MTITKAPKKVTITDQQTINALSTIQQQFIAKWNHNERNWVHCDDDHGLPNGAQFISSLDGLHAGGTIGVGFWLPGDTYVCLLAVRSWRGWHDGWSFERHVLLPEQIRKVVVIGSFEVFEQWLEKTA